MGSAKADASLGAQAGICSGLELFRERVEYLERSRWLDLSQNGAGRIKTVGKSGKGPGEWRCLPENAAGGTAGTQRSLRRSRGELVTLIICFVWCLVQSERNMGSMQKVGADLLHCGFVFVWQNSKPLLAT
jgi:hypothetical protein